jgi:hypothetical protein
LVGSRPAAPHGRVGRHRPDGSSRPCSTGQTRLIREPLRATRRPRQTGTGGAAPKSAAGHGPAAYNRHLAEPPFPASSSSSRISCVWTGRSHGRVGRHRPHGAYRDAAPAARGWSANSCERRVACGRRETAAQRRNPPQVTDLRHTTDTSRSRRFPRRRAVRGSAVSGRGARTGASADTGRTVRLADRANGPTLPPLRRRADAVVLQKAADELVEPVEGV